MPARKAKTPGNKGGANPTAGRPRKPSNPEKESIERGRSKARGHAEQVVDQWIEELQATKHVVTPKGEVLGDAPDYATRDRAKDALARLGGYDSHPESLGASFGDRLLHMLDRAAEVAE